MLLAAHNDTVECDYLILGAGVEQLAFADSLLLENRTCTIIFADMGGQPGGHWCDAAPFARLEQTPSSFGVGSWRFDAPQDACRDEILQYCKTIMQRLLQHRRARYFPQTMFDGRQTLSSIAEPDWVRNVVVRRKIVDSFLEPSPVCLRKAPFHVAAGATVITPEKMPLIASSYSRYAVIGSSRSAVECVIWLLQRGVSPDMVHWVVAQEPWFVCAESMQPDKYVSTAGVFWRAFRTCKTVQELELHLEEANIRCRIDGSHLPTSFNGDHITRSELALLRRIATNVVRKGRVCDALVDRLICERGEVPLCRGTLYIDCSGDCDSEAHSPTEIFGFRRITLQLVREVADNGPPSKCFVAAMIGFLEAIFPTQESLTNSLCTPMLPPRTVVEALRNELFSMRAGPKLREQRQVASFLVIGRPGRFSALGVADIRQLVKERSHKSEQLEVLANLERLTQEDYQLLPAWPIAPTTESSYDKGTPPDALNDASSEAPTICRSTTAGSSPDFRGFRIDSSEFVPRNISSGSVISAPFDFDELDVLEEMQGLA